MFSGSLAEWFSGVVSLVALVGAWKAYKISYELMKNDNNRLSNEMEMQRRKHAEQVYATYVFRKNDKDEMRYALLLANKSNSVIRNVCIKATFKDESFICYPAKAVYLVPGEYVIDAKLEGNKVSWENAHYLGSLEQQKVYRPLGNTPNFIVKSLEFTDAAGIRWQIDENGKLSELEDQIL